MFYDNNYVQTFPSLMLARLSRQVRLRAAARCVRLSGGPAPVCATPSWPGRRLAWALCAAALFAGTPCVAQTAAASASASTVSLERKVKAAFLYKFLGYTEFPAAALGEPSAPVVIGVVDADELAAELTRIVNGRTVLARPIAVKVFREQEAPSGVHLLFVGGADALRVRHVLRSVQAAPMLLVTEAEDGLRQGSVINFRIVDERVRFDVSLPAADKNSVKLSSRLLTVANLVHKGAP